MARKNKSESTELDELIRIRKLLILQLVSQGISPSIIGKALGVTAASRVRELVPVKEIPKKAKD